MDLLASYDSDSDSSDNNSGVPLIPPLTDSSTNSTQCPSTSSTQGFSTDSTQDSQSSTATTAPRFPTRLPPPQAYRAITATVAESIVSPDDQDQTSVTEQRVQLRLLSSPPLIPEIPLLPIAADGGRLVAQFLALKQQQSNSSSSFTTSAGPVHFNFKFAASPQLHDPTFVSHQAEFLGISDQYVSKFIQPGDRAKARAAVRQRAIQRAKVEFTASANAT